MQTEIATMNQLLGQASLLLRQAVELGAGARDRGPEARHAVDRAWEEFLGSFFAHLKQVSRQRGVNLLAGISFSRVMAARK